MTLTLSINTNAWQFACDKANAVAERAHVATQAAKPEGERTAFVPVTVAEYVQARVADIEASYLAQQIQEQLALISAQDPASIARLAKAAALPSGPVRDALAAQVDQL